MDSKRLIFWNWIKLHYDTVGLFMSVISFLIPFCALVFSAYQYVDIEKDKYTQQRYENYHMLIERFGGGQRGSLSISAASIYELKSYPEYCAISIRILKYFKELWKDPFLANEINLTLPSLIEECDVKT